MSYQYLLDANIFIQAKRFYYPMDIFPGFWSWLEQENITGKLSSIISIYNEIKDGGDELSKWAKRQDKKEWFLPVDEPSTQLAFSQIANWVANKDYKPHAVEEFLDCADSWLIAKAKSIGATVVTQEKPAPESKNRILIPDICNHFNVPYINTIELIRKLGGRF